MTELKPCPFCGGKDITMVGYDYGRGFAPVDTETECVMFECQCGCKYTVPIPQGVFISVKEVISHAEEQWNRRAEQ